MLRVAVFNLALYFSLDYSKKISAKFKLLDAARFGLVGFRLMNFEVIEASIEKCSTSSSSESKLSTGKSHVTTVSLDTSANSVSNNHDEENFENNQ